MSGDPDDTDGKHASDNNPLITRRGAIRSIGGVAVSLTAFSGINAGATATFKIKNKSTGKVLDVENRSTANGANVHQWEYNGKPNNEWKLDWIDSEIGTLEGTAKIINEKSGKALEVQSGSNSNGANVQQWEYNDKSHQEWEIEHDPVARGYIISNVNSSSLLEVKGDSDNNGANVQQWEQTGAVPKDHKVWRLKTV